MNDQDRDELAKRYFPFLANDEAEKMITFSLSASKGKKVGKSPSLDTQMAVLDMVRGILQTYRSTPMVSQDRQRLRRKLLNLSGLHRLIPIMTLQQSLGLDSRAPGPVIYPTVDSEDDIYNQILEIPGDILDRLQNISVYLSVTKRTNETYLDYVKKSAFSIVFQPTIQDDVRSEVYVSASSETLSKTILISTTIASGESRDAFSIAFDLVMQASFLDVYFNFSNLYKPLVVERIARLRAYDFGQKLNRMLTQKLGENRELTYFSNGKTIQLTQNVDQSTYFGFIRNFLADNAKAIDALNSKLGI